MPVHVDNFFWIFAEMSAVVEEDETEEEEEEDEDEEEVGSETVVLIPRFAQFPFFY